MPRFVERELPRFLECGILAQGEDSRREPFARGNPGDADEAWLSVRDNDPDRPRVFAGELGREADPEQADVWASDEPILAALYAARVHGRVVTGPRTGPSENAD